ncbi:helix-turn-helix domain-containing protein, partial [Bacillus cereus group sp. BfR-BA-01383]|uniref:helix-turn-helix domain-containing protein n=1 Tax=Bacillus cereus group sp. BfR-BA-01383 TaxID=2920327 RepID=UPI001F5A3CC0
MLVNKAYKFRIYPNKKQEIVIAKKIGCSRFVWFWCKDKMKTSKTHIFLTELYFMLQVQTIDG